MTAKRVFVSASHNDRAAARAIMEALRAAGAVVSSDELIPAGEDVLDRVVEEVGRSDLLVFLVPEREGEGKNALMELGMAKAKGTPIVPVVLDDTRIANSHVATTLSGTVYLDASGFPPAEIGRRIMAAAN